MIVMFHKDLMTDLLEKMAEKTDLDSMASGEKSTATILNEITMRMQQAFSQTQTQASTTSGHEIAVKLDVTNYAFWS